MLFCESRIEPHSTPVKHTAVIDHVEEQSVALLVRIVLFWRITQLFQIFFNFLLVRLSLHEFYNV